MSHQIVLGLDRLPSIIKDTNCKKLLLVVGSSYFRQHFKTDIDAIDIEKVYFSEYTPNPLYDQICKGVELFKTEHCDGILAIGGGSPIDVAKCIKLAVLAEAGNNAIIPPIVNTKVNIDGTRIPFIAIPTTAGTGSESTHNAVMYYNGSKQTVTNNGILPDYAILDASVLKTLSDYQKKCTMMDALCQAIESWWSINSTELSYQYSRKAIEFIMKNWEAYIFRDDVTAAANILIASNYAGRAINITATTAAHAMSYKITSLYGLPHGHAVACCLPFIWKYMVNNMDKTIDSRGADHLNNIFTEIAFVMGFTKVEDAIDKFCDMMKKMELKHPTLSSAEDLDILAKSVNPIRLKNNPIYLSEEVLRNLYIKITK